MDDVILADQCGYPDHLKYKLYQRHAKCLCEIFRFKEAEIIFDKAVKAVEDSR